MSAKPDDLLRLQALAPRLASRSRCSRLVRDFFHGRGFVEIETPARILSPAPEDHINSPPCGRHFLRSSPELHMKRLVAAGMGKIFQLGPCFREGERGKLHNEEFAMLEWYEAATDYNGLQAFLRDLLRFVAQGLHGSTRVKFRGQTIDFAADWEELTVADAFVRYAGVTPEAALADDLFEILLTEKVEPALPRDRPALLKDYPAAMSALARLKPGSPSVAERWELYLGGMELANAYSELIDPVEQESRFAAAAARRLERGLPPYPPDEDFLAALRHGIPPFAGCALGFDRLVMALTDAERIDEVIAFTEAARD